MGWASIASGTSVINFQLGATWQPGVYYAPSVFHGHYGPNVIRVKFDTDVNVDFYDLQLSSVNTNAFTYTVPLSGFSYDDTTHSAYWQISGMPSDVNDRFEVRVTGVWDKDGNPLDGGVYTTNYTILTCDVSGDDAVGAVDALTLINAINASDTNNPNYDVNFDGIVSAMDVLLVINKINNIGSGLSLIPSGTYQAVPMDPPPNLYFKSVSCTESDVTLRLAGIPIGSIVTVEKSSTLATNEWYEVTNFVGASAVTNVVLPIDLKAGKQFYRARFE